MDANISSTLRDQQKFPKNTISGGVLKDEVIVCGGANWKHQVDPFSECYAFKNNQVSFPFIVFHRVM